MQGKAKLMIDKVKSFSGSTVLLESGLSLNADILVTACMLLYDKRRKRFCGFVLLLQFL